LGCRASGWILQHGSSAVLKRTETVNSYPVEGLDTLAGRVQPQCGTRVTHPWQMVLPRWDLERPGGQLVRSLRHHKQY
jgi:hypothetical protein